MKCSALFPIRLAAGSAVVLLMAGCATQTVPSLYGWNGYQAGVYEYLKSDGNANPEGQLSKLEIAQRQIEQEGRDLPPGYRATMGMLYVNAGQAGKGAERFAAEKSHFPESSTFMDFLTRNLAGKSQ